MFFSGCLWFITFLQWSQRRERVQLARHGVREWSCVSVGCVCVSLFLLFCNLFVGVLGLRTISIPEFIVVVGVDLSNFLMVSYPSIQRGRRCQPIQLSDGLHIPAFNVIAGVNLSSHIPAFNMVVGVNLSNFLMVLYPSIQRGPRQVSPFLISQHSTWSLASTYPTFSWSLVLHIPHTIQRHPPMVQNSVKAVTRAPCSSSPTGTLKISASLKCVLACRKKIQSSAGFL